MIIEKVEKLGLKNERNIISLTQKIKELEGIIEYFAMVMGIDLDELLNEEDEYV